jgi:DeoR family transcriptional regulator, deoxyribose operon repressor
MNKQAVRLNEIVGYLKERQMTTVAALADSCGVSEVTIRRDLKQLSDEGIVNTLNGTVSMNLKTDKMRMGDKYYISQQAEKQKVEKMRIASKAVELIEPHATIVIDVGTTTYFLARAIPADLPVTVICYSLNTFIELHDKEACTVIFAGGVFHKNSLMCESPQGIDLIRCSRASIAFLGASGVHHKMGLTSSHYNEQALKQAVITSSVSRALLVDSTKFGVVKPAYFADIDDIDTVITDTGVPEEYDSWLQDSDVSVFKV